MILIVGGGCQPKVGWTPPPPPPPSPPPPPKVEYQVFYVAADRLNLRACPGMDCPKIGTLTRNQEVEKVGESQGWFQVRSRQNGTLGWVDARYLASAPVPEAATLPATEASPPRTPKALEPKPETQGEVKPKPKPKSSTVTGEEEVPKPPLRRVPEAEAAEPPAEPAPAPETPAAPPLAPAAPSEPPKKKIRIM
ncbi:MAG: SH3 domain-containing protein [Desulfobacca sp.]